MKKLRIVGIVAVLLLLVSLVGTAQAETKISAPEEQWSRTFGGTSSDYTESVQQTADGGYILAGHTESYGAGCADFWLVKTDSAGNEQWSRTFGGTDWDYANSVRQTADGGYILAGHTWSYGAGRYDLWLVKTDSAGNEQWSRTFGGTGVDHAESVQQTADGGYILAGSTDSYGAGSYDFWLVKTDSAGNEQWDKTFGGTSFDAACSIQQTADGGYILAGHTKSYGAGSHDFWLVKTDSSGNEEWSRTFGGTGWDRANSVQQTSDGGYIIAGWTESYGAGESDVWLIKTDSAGNEEWNRTFGGTNDDCAWSVQQTVDDGYILAGHTYSYGAGSYDFWLVKTDSAGNEEWNRTFGGTDGDCAESIQQTADGGYVLAGHTLSYGEGSYDVWLIKVKGDIPKIEIIDIFETENPLNQEIMGKVFNYDAPSLDIHLNGEPQKIDLRDREFDGIIQLKEGKNKIEFVIDGEVHKTINISTVKFEIPKETYSFTNSEFTEEYALTYDQFNNLLRSYLVGVSTIKANIIAPFVFVSTEKGNCYGMSSTTILYHDGMKKPVDKDVYEMSMDDSASNIHAFQVGQAEHLFSYYVNYLLEPDEKISYDHIVESIEKDHKPVVLTTWLKVHGGLEALYDALTGKYQSHAVVAYKTYELDGKKRVVVYENKGRYPSVEDCTDYAVFDFSKKNAFSYMEKQYVAENIREVPYSFYPTIGQNTAINVIVDNFLRELTKLLHTHGLKLISVSCPVNVSITDESGRMIADNGTNQIENAKVIATDDVKLFFIPDGLTYSININAYEEGNFALTQFSPIDSERANATEFNSSVTPKTKASILISPEEVSEMKIDYNGNGTIDEEKKPVKEIIEVAPEKPTGEKPGIPGFVAIIAIAGLLAVAYLLRRRG